ncbi:MAG: SAM-dependent methyltransferase [Planctomycetota bacterium]
MTKSKLTLKSLVLLACLLSLVGCDRLAKERNKAVEEAMEAKAALEKVKADLEETQSERDQLKEYVDNISENWENVLSELNIVRQNEENLQVQISELAGERDAAIAEAKEAQVIIERLSEQLKNKSAEIIELQDWVAELQLTIQELQNQIGKIGEEFGTESYGEDYQEFYEESNEGIYEKPYEELYEEINKEVKETRAPDIEFIPTPQDVVDKMLELAKVKKDDLVYDLGCGDGRIVVTAAKRYGCKAIGYDIDPQRVKESLENVEKNGVGHLVRIEEKDIFTLDLSKANVITLYLLPELNVELISQLEKLKPGSRIVSHDFGMEGVQPDKVITVNSNEDEDEHEIYLWMTPLKNENGM